MDFESERKRDQHTNREREIEREREREWCLAGQKRIPIQDHYF